MRFGIRATEAVVTVARVGAFRGLEGGHIRRPAGTNMRLFGTAIAACPALHANSRHHPHSFLGERFATVSTSVTSNAQGHVALHTRT